MAKADERGAAHENKPFADWGHVFTDAASVTVMVDRLVHRSELIAIEGASYRMHEAEERKKRRRSRSRKPQSAGSEEA